MGEPFSFDRLKQRKLVQWALAYLAGAWAILEVAGYVGDQFGWPVVVGQILTILASQGFVPSWFWPDTMVRRADRRSRGPSY